MMDTAFQADAFQNDTFQIATPVSTEGAGVGRVPVYIEPTKPTADLFREDDEIIIL